MPVTQARASCSSLAYSSKMTTFSSLPPEIHLSISDHLEYLQDVNSLVRTSHSFFARLNPYLYSRISHDIFNPTRISSGRKSTVLHTVAEKGMHDSVRRLLQAGIPTNPATHNCQHPMMIAAGMGHAETVQVFIDHGVDPSPPTGFELRRRGDFGNPLTEAVIHGRLSVIKLLIERGVDLQFDKGIGYVLQPLYLAVKQGHIEVVKLLLDQGVSPMTPNFYPLEETNSEEEESVLAVDNSVFVANDTVFVAAALHSMEMLELVLGKATNPDSIFLGDFDGLLPAAAIQKYDLPLLKHLWKYVSPADQQISQWSESKRLSPGRHDRDIFAQFAWIAGYHKGLDMALFLLDQIDVEMVLACPYMRPVVCLLQGAACLGDTGLMSRLLKVDFKLKEPHATEKWHDALSSVLEQSVRLGHISATKLLLDHGADPNGKPDPDAPFRPLNPLLKAIQNGHMEIANLVLDRGADPFATQFSAGPFAETTLWPSFEYGEDLEVLEFFIERNILTNRPKDDERYHEVLIYAARKDEAVFGMVLQHTGITLDPRNPYHQRAMGAAIGAGSVSLLKRFLQAGFDPNYITNDDNKWGDSSCLANAAMSTNGEAMVDLLLEHGADLALGFGRLEVTPLFIVLQDMCWSSDECVEKVDLLLKKGADPLQAGGLAYACEDNLLNICVKGDVPLIVERILQSFDERGLDFKTAESAIKQAYLIAEDWGIVKLLWRWYWPKLYPCP